MLQGLRSLLFNKNVNKENDKDAKDNIHYCAHTTAAYYVNNVLVKEATNVSIKNNTLHIREGSHDNSPLVYSQSLDADDGGSKGDSLLKMNRFILEGMINSLHWQDASENEHELLFDAPFDLEEEEEEEGESFMRGADDNGKSISNVHFINKLSSCTAMEVEGPPFTLAANQTIHRRHPKQCKFYVFVPEDNSFNVPPLLSEDNRVFLKIIKETNNRVEGDGKTDTNTAEDIISHFYLCIHTPTTTVLYQQLTPSLTLHTNPSHHSIIWTQPPLLHTFSLVFPAATGADVGGDDDDLGGMKGLVAWSAYMNECIYELLNEGQPCTDEWLKGAMIEDTTMGNCDEVAAEDEEQTVYRNHVYISESSEDDEEEYSEDDEDEEYDQENPSVGTKNEEEMQRLLVGRHNLFIANQGKQTLKIINKHSADHSLNNNSEGSNPSVINLPYKSSKQLLYEGEKSLLLLEGAECRKMDIEYGKIVDEWSTLDYNNGKPASSGDQGVIVDICAHKKGGQATMDPLLTACTEQSTLLIDPRLPSTIAASKTYKTPIAFTATTTTQQGHSCVANERGELRFYDAVGASAGKRAKTLLAGYGAKIEAVDVCADGSWLVASAGTFLLWLRLNVDCEEGPKSAFTSTGFAKHAPPPTILTLKPEHQALMQSSPRFTPPTISADSTRILSSSGPFVITWRVEDLLKGKKWSYQVAKVHANSTLYDSQWSSTCNDGGGGSSNGDNKEIFVGVAGGDVERIASDALRRPTPKILRSPSSPLSQRKQKWRI